MVENDMVQKFNAECFPGCLELSSDLDILFAGSQSADRVVMGYDNTGGPIGDGISEDLPWVYLGLIDQTNRDDPCSNYLIGPVK